MVNVAASQLNQATILVELGDVETAYALAVDAARVFAAAGDAEMGRHRNGLSLRAMVRAGLGDGTHVAGIETCVAFLADEGDEEVTAFQDVGLIESLLLIGNIAAATQRAMRLIDVVDRFGDDHLLPTTVRRILAIATEAPVIARPASNGSTRPGHEPTFIGSCRNRRRSQRLMPAVPLTSGRRTDNVVPTSQRNSTKCSACCLDRCFRHGRDSSEP